MDSILEIVAGMMALSARTAPKALGADFIEIKILTGADINKLADEMEKYGREKGRRNYDRDGDNVRRSSAVLLLSLTDSEPLGADCGACGLKSCREMKEAFTEGADFAGPLCSWRVLDLGIALGSAVKTASLFNADNRIMFRIGVVARRMGLIRGEMVIGVPISATGKNIYFDRQ
ncbi:MAG: hypothetical protein GX890_07830 [Firmicutes bacterium]|jgi:uncharacterized ferredoxin-like protein|nr:hypothetical protein [Bacillota bacterium]HPU00659.1 DUF2148 domain-containing protein [Bacillota bacterium]